MDNMGNQNSLTVGEIAEIKILLSEMKNIIRSDIAQLSELQGSYKADRLKEIERINYLIQRLNDQRVQ